MYFLVCHFSDYSLALMAHIKQQNLQNVFVLSVDTGWGAASWRARVTAAEKWVHLQGFQWIRLKSAQNFSELIEARSEFPSPRFQWCASLLKGITLLDWMDRIDPEAKAVVVLPKTRLIDPRCDAEWVEASEPFGERRLWFPLYAESNEAIKTLASTTGLPWWGHPSLECAPCLHHSPSTQTLYQHENTPEKAFALKLKIPFPHYETNDEHDRFGGYQRGCGNLFGCGL